MCFIGLWVFYANEKHKQCIIVAWTAIEASTGSMYIKSNKWHISWSQNFLWIRLSFTHSASQSQSNTYFFVCLRASIVMFLNVYETKNVIFSCINEWSSFLYINHNKKLLLFYHFTLNLLIYFLTILLSLVFTFTLLNFLCSYIKLVLVLFCLNGSVPVDLASANTNLGRTYINNQCTMYIL